MLGEDKELRGKVETLSHQVEELEQRLERLERAYKKQQNHLIHQELSHGLADNLPQEKSPVRTSVAAPGSRAPGHASPPQKDSGGTLAGVSKCNIETFPAYGGAGPAGGQTAAVRSRLQHQRGRWSSPASALTQSTVTEQESVQDFVTRYNELPSEGGITDRDARRQFLQALSVQGFSCANSEERMSNPKIASRYAAEEVMRADYWAMQVKGDFYAVVPSAKLIYDSAHHAAGGMMEAFDSNFEVGHTYRQICVEKPAYFWKRGGCWSVAQKGRLRLSE